MGKLKALLIVSAAMVAATGARAADLLPPPVAVPHPMYEPADFSGWYLRGDVGVGIPGSTDHRSTFAPGVRETIPGFAEVTSSLESAAFVGFGFGYRFNSWFRVDATGEYRTRAAYQSLNYYDGSSDIFSPCNDCFDQYRATLASGVFLVNGYFDLGTWAGVTPYIGAGVGGAYHSVKDITDHNVTTGTGFGYGRGKSQWDFAWALMAGVSYSVTPNLALELGYRYLDMGSANTGEIDCAGGCGIRERQSFKVTSHDLRLGMRWQFADAPIAPAPPLVAKY